MDEAARADLEQRIREHCEGDAFDRAATIAVRGYGPEILGYLTAVAGTESDASEAFSMFCEDMWKGLPQFRWASSFRTWAYTLARHALHRYRRDPKRRPGRNVAISDAPGVYEVAEQVRTTTMVHLRTEIKDEFARLRAELDEDDRTLLILRVDRNMSWNEIAGILGDEPDAGDHAVRRTAATLRKRFERAKDRLRKLAKERGLL